MPSMGLQEWVVLFLIVLIIFGPSSLPKIGKALGKGIREFKDAMSGISSTLEQEEENKTKKTQTTTRSEASTVERTDDTNPRSPEG
jgi:sec-independent protein translocase protein TatA